MAAKHGANGLRRVRDRLDLGQTIVAGGTRHRQIVYGYGFPSHPGRIKIGYSSRGLARVVEQATSFPEKPVIFFMIRHPNAKGLEAAFHRAFEHRQNDTLGVEWFDVTLDEVIAVSPELRRALGRGRAIFRLRVVASLAFGLAGLAEAPWLYLQFDTLLNASVPLEIGRQAAGSYARALAAGQFGEALAAVRELLSTLTYEDATAASVLALAPVPALVVLPWLLRRPQVRA